MNYQQIEFMRKDKGNFFYSLGLTTTERPKNPGTQTSIDIDRLAGVQLHDSDFDDIVVLGPESSRVTRFSTSRNIE